MTSKTMVNVGKRRRLRALLEKQQAQGIPEPIRKSLYEVIHDNLQLADRVTLREYRVIYAGEHTFPDSEILSEIFEKLVKECNKEYYSEKLTGMLLHYPQYFCVVIDGGEELLGIHFQHLLSKEEMKKNVVRMKLLVAYHNINMRFLKNWVAFTAKPPTLLETLNPQSDIPQTYSVVNSAIRKLYNLAIDLRPKPDSSDTETGGVKNKSSTSAHSPGSKTTLSSVEIEGRRLTLVRQDTVQVAENRFIHCLPEYAVLEFILNSPYVQELSEYANMYGVIPDIVFPEEKTWPISSDFVPMDVFETPKDPVTDFPQDLLSVYMP